MRTLPGYIKYFVILASLVLTVYVLMVARPILSPIITALIAALLLRPLSSLIERLHIPRIVSSLLSIIVVIGVIFGISYFFSTQVNSIAENLTSIGQRFNEIIDRIYAWMESTFGIEQQQQTQYIKDTLNTFFSSSVTAVSKTVSATAGFFTGFFMFLIALFFILYYRRFLVSFLYMVFPDESHQKLNDTIFRIEGVVRAYILGLLTVILIIAILNSVGLMILGIQYAIFFGCLAAVLTIIPYIGIFIGSLLPILFALVTKDSLWYPVGVALLFWFVQLIEGNFITPNIVGGKVSVNPFAALLALFIGGMIWGAMGMILSIPVLAIIKVICDAVEPLKPIGYLLDTPPEEETYQTKPIRIGRFIKKILKEKNKAL